MPTLAPDVEQCIFRVAQEAVTNVTHHAGANLLQLHLAATDEAINLRVRDDGRGFDAAVGELPGHFGLAGMRARAQLAGGAVTIDSRPGHSASYQTLVKAATSGFARWLIEEKQLLHRNPARGIQVASQPLLAPRVLSDDQRYILRNLVEKENDPRGAAIFALGYWAGCRVSDVSWLRLKHTDVRPRSGSLVVGYKGGKTRSSPSVASSSIVRKSR